MTGRDTSNLGGHVALAGACRCTAVDAALAVTPRAEVVGRLHDRVGTARALGLPTDSCDAELVAEAWRRSGADGLRLIDGEYAAVLVGNEPTRVTLIRDHIGTHPLLWHSDGRCVRYATSMAAMLAMLPGRPRVDEVTVARFLRDPGTLKERTFLEGVRMVEPGYVVTVDGRGTRVHCWWRPEELAQEQRLSRADFREEVRSLVASAVAERIADDVPVGVHLSGGLDSTLVALVASELLAQQDRPLRRAYAWSPPVSDVDPLEGPDDDRLRLGHLADELGLDLHLSQRDAAHLLAFLRRPLELEGTADVFDELPTLAAAAVHGSRVLLSGWGGDEVVSAHAPNMPAFHVRAGRPVAALRALRALNGGLRPIGGLLHRAWRNAAVPLLPGPLYRLTPFFADVNADGAYLGAALRPHLGPDVRGPRFRLTGDPRADLIRLVQYGHLGERMATWSVWGAEHGVQHRYPLTDRRLMERVLTAPTGFLWGDGRPRYPARVAVGDRTRLPMAKSDPSNERQRLRMFRAAWRSLGDEVRAGGMQDDCAWLDMAALRRDLLQGPSGDDVTDAVTIARMMPALRVLDLWRRYA